MIDNRSTDQPTTVNCEPGIVNSPVFAIEVSS